MVISNRYRACVAVLLFVAATAPRADAPPERDRRCADSRVANGWRVLRAVECARCHGGDYTGLAAPSIVTFTRTQNRDSFNRIVLEGDPVRGMPGYRGNARVADNLDDIYRYLVARADGDIGPDYRPPPSAEAMDSNCAGGSEGASAPPR